MTLSHKNTRHVCLSFLVERAVLIVFVANCGPQVRALPTVVAFRDGEAVNRIVGALPESGVRNFLNDV
jgi:hypothetical protein